MGYVYARQPQIARAFGAVNARRARTRLRSALSGHMLAGPSGAPRRPYYYASPAALRWTSSDMKKLHDTLVGVDAQWQALLGALPFSAVPDKKMRGALQQLAGLPMPYVAPLACILEATAGQRPMDAVFKSALELLHDNAEDSVAALVVVGSGATALAGLSFTLTATGVLAPGTIPTAATFASIAGVAAVAGALADALATLLQGLVAGSLSEDDYRKLIRAGAAATGTAVSDSEIIAGADAFTAAQEALLHTRADALTVAKAKSKAKTAACVARGGVYDPTAPNGCRVPPKGPTPDERKAKQARDDTLPEVQKALGELSNATWWVVGGLVAAAAGFVAWRTFV